jgi:integrase
MAKKPRPKGTGGISKPPGTRFYWINYIGVDGHRHHESTKSTRLDDAQRMLTDRLGDVQRGVPVTPKMGRKTFGEGVGSVIANQKANGRRSVAHTERRVVKHIKPHFGSNRLLGSITTADLDEYVAARLAASAAPASINQELAIIKRAFRLAIRAKELIVMPHVPMLTLDNVREGFFERAEFEAVRAELPPALRGPVTLAYLTGWRIKSEVIPLEWKQVERERRVIRLEPGTTKNRRGRTLPYGLLPELVEVIEAAWVEHEQLKEAGTICPLVFQRHGQPIRSFQKAWEAARKRAGCPAKLLHDFRRTAVRNLVRAGVPEKTAMGITGHKTRSVFDRYDIVSEDDLRGALGRLAEAGQPAPAAQGRVVKIGDGLKNGSLR